MEFENVSYYIEKNVQYMRVGHRQASTIII